METFDPPAENGERRLAGWSSGGYVNLLRSRAEQLTGASSREWGAQKLAAVAGIPYTSPFARLQEHMTLPFCGELLRLEYALGTAPVSFTVAVDGIPVSSKNEPAAARPIDCRLLTVLLSEGAHTLSLSINQGELPIYRMETYAGPVAVINSGIGSCPCFRFREEHWDEYVKAVQPDVVLAEAHTINDWLAGASPAVYETRLTSLLKDFAALGASVTLLTVSPILGEQRWQGGPPYTCYSAAARRAAAVAGVSICDAGAVMARCLDGLSDSEAAAYLFSDSWHPNDRGHALYAELLFGSLCQQGFLPPVPNKSLYLL